MYIMSQINNYSVINHQPRNMNTKMRLKHQKLIKGKVSLRGSAERTKDAKSYAPLPRMCLFFALLLEFGKQTIISKSSINHCLKTQQGNSTAINEACRSKIFVQMSLNNNQVSTENFTNSNSFVESRS